MHLKAGLAKTRRWTGLSRRWRFAALLGVGGAIALGYALGTDSPLTHLDWTGWATLAVVLLTFGLNAATSLPAEIIFLGGLGVLFVSGILDEASALAGFSNSGMVTVGVLYIVVTGIQQTGALGWISQKVLGLPRTPSRALLRLMLPIMGLSAVLNNTPVVALFIPVVNTWCRKLRISPSKLMIPLSYAAIFGGTCTLIGTSTNLVVNGLLIAETDYSSLQFLDITWVGVPCAIAGTTFLFLTQRWLLPERKPVMGDAEDVRQYTVEMVIAPEGPLVGKTVEQAGLRQLPSLYLAEIVRGPVVLPAVSPKELLRADDQLVFVGLVDSIVDLHRLPGLAPATDQVFKLDGRRSDRCLIEAVVSDSCPLVGRTIREGQFRSRYSAVVLAVARNGARLQGKIGDIRLRPGDTLLLETNPAFLERQRSSRDFYLVSGIPDSEPLRHEKAPMALVVLTAMVVVATLGWLSMLQAAIIAAIVLLATGCCSPSRALRNVEWSVLLVIGAALGIGKALEVTGAAGAIATTLLGFAGENPWLALAMVYGITTLLTEVVTNNAAAALMFPIALALAQTLGVSFMPFVISIMVGASASFSTPIGYQTNLMVYGPGGYRFTDFMRVGIPLNLLFWAITIAIAPLVYPF
ncbi:SLC13 family permease [Leptolyngbya sp. PCC 6406]|uniref:SLC13 family permease n=1 Tax=Leptolyngbya sp. PCC 6406 TaxID=1173264 RepID=UPI0002ACC462|nr:SLC13 family permease [Leptolyngbya sp. PCC 6406]